MRRSRAAGLRLLFAAALAAAVALAVAPGCGKKGPPIPLDAKEAQVPAGGSAAPEPVTDDDTGEAPPTDAR